LIKAVFNASVSTCLCRVTHDEILKSVYACCLNETNVMAKSFKAHRQFNKYVSVSGDCYVHPLSGLCPWALLGNFRPRTLFGPLNFERWLRPRLQRQLSVRCVRRTRINPRRTSHTVVNRFMCSDRNLPVLCVNSSHLDLYATA